MTWKKEKEKMLKILPAKANDTKDKKNRDGNQRPQRFKGKKERREKQGNNDPQKKVIAVYISSPLLREKDTRSFTLFVVGVDVKR